MSKSPYDLPRTILTLVDDGISNGLASSETDSASSTSSDNSFTSKQNRMDVDYSDADSHYSSNRSEFAEDGERMKFLTLNQMWLKRPLSPMHLL